MKKLLRWIKSRLPLYSENAVHENWCAGYEMGAANAKDRYFTGVERCPKTGKFRRFKP